VLDTWRRIDKCARCTIWIV